MSRSKQRRLDFTSSLTSEPPSCPECHKTLKQRDIAKCNYCGFHLGYLEKLFPTDLPVLEQFKDFSNLVSEQEESQLRSLVKKIETKYPQLLVKTMVLPLQADVEIQQMALWMLNECPSAEEENEVSRLWTIFILVNSSAMKCCFAEGYKVEVVLPQIISSDLVSQTNLGLRDGDIAAALNQTYRELLINLDHSKKMVKKQFRRFNRNKSK